MSKAEGTPRAVNRTIVEETLPDRSETPYRVGLRIGDGNGVAKATDTTAVAPPPPGEDGQDAPALPSFDLEPKQPPLFNLSGVTLDTDFGGASIHPGTPPKPSSTADDRLSKKSNPNSSKSCRGSHAAIA